MQGGDVGQHLDDDLAGLQLDHQSVFGVFDFHGLGLRGCEREHQGRHQADSSEHSLLRSYFRVAQG
jgi:hypothetical protein